MPRDIRFQETEDYLKTLKNEVAAGQRSPEDADKKLKERIFTDTDGTSWLLSFITNTWKKRPKGSKLWEPAIPPEEQNSPTTGGGGGGSISGSGGDYVLGYLTSSAPAADALIARGPGRTLACREEVHAVVVHADLLGLLGSGVRGVLAPGRAGASRPPSRRSW